MIYLRFSIDSDFYGFEIEKIIEIVPWVSLRKIPGTPDYIPGIFKYRNLIVPVVDLTMLTTKRESKKILSSRITIVKYRKEHLLGLLMENVTDIADINTSPDALQEPGIKTDMDYMGNISVDAHNKMLQLVTIDNLLAEPVQKMIFASDIEEKICD